MHAISYDGIPLVKGMPLVGNLPKFLRDPLANARSLEVPGNVVRSRTFFETVTLLGPEANQFVLHDREGDYSSRGWLVRLDRRGVPGRDHGHGRPGPQATPAHHAGRLQALGDGALRGRHGAGDRRRAGTLASRHV